MANEKLHTFFDLTAKLASRDGYGFQQLLTLGASITAGIGAHYAVEALIPGGHWVLQSFCESTATMSVAMAFDFLFWSLRDSCSPESEQDYDPRNPSWSTQKILYWQSVSFFAGTVIGFGVDAIPEYVHGASEAIDTYGASVAVAGLRAFVKNYPRFFNEAVKGFSNNANLQEEEENLMYAVQPSHLV